MHHVSTSKLLGPVEASTCDLVLLLGIDIYREFSSCKPIDLTTIHSS
jgi:hypothetical protein